MALRRANTYNGGAIRDALLAVGKNYPGASGSITFNSSGERITGSYGIWKVAVEGTQYRYVVGDDVISLVKP